MTSEIKVLNFAEGTPVSSPTTGTPVSIVNQKLRSVEQIDSTTTGTDQTTITNTSSIMKMTNAGLVSMSGIAGWATSQYLVWMNDTGNPVLVLNDSATSATDGILTGTGIDIEVESGAALWMVRIDSLNRWVVVGGTGSGTGAGLSFWATATEYDAGDIVVHNYKIYQCLIDHTSGVFLTDLLAAKWKELSKTPIEIQSTCITEGAAISIGTPNTTVTIAAGKAVFVDNTGGNDLRTEISWVAFTNMSLTFIGSSLVTFLGIDVTGTIIQQTTPFTPTQTRTIAPIGTAVHSNLTIVNAVNNQQAFGGSPFLQHRDLSEALGIFNVGTGNVFSANGANLSLNKTIGSVHKIGSNFTTDPLNPNIKVLNALTALSFRYREQDGGETADLTSIDPNTYDVAGVPTTVSNGRFTIQRINIFTSNLVRIQYGQAEYASISDALSGITSEQFVTEANIRDNGLLRGYLIVKKGTTNLQSASDALFVEASKFGASGGSSTVTKFCPPSFPQWYYGNAVSPTADFTDGIHFDQFDNVSNQQMYAMLTVPDEYVAGSPIKLKGLQFISGSITGNVLFRAQATLIASNTILGTGSYSNQRTSTNSQVAVSGIANTSVSIGEIDVSSATGVIGAAVAPGHKILVRLYRDNTNETSGAALDARLVRDGIVTFS